MQLTPQNSNLEDIPLAELVEDLINKRVQIEVIPTKARYPTMEDK